MSEQQHKVGDRVTFRPGPRSTSDVTGKVASITTTGTGRGKSTFLVVDCDDGQQRKIRPGAARAA